MQKDIRRISLIILTVVFNIVVLDKFSEGCEEIE